MGKSRPVVFSQFVVSLERSFLEAAGEGTSHRRFPSVIPVLLPVLLWWSNENRMPVSSSPCGAEGPASHAEEANIRRMETRRNVSHLSIYPSIHPYKERVCFVQSSAAFWITKETV